MTRSGATIPQHPNLKRGTQSDRRYIVRPGKDGWVLYDTVLKRIVVYRIEARKAARELRDTWNSTLDNGKSIVLRGLGRGEFVGTGEASAIIGVEPPRIGRWMRNHEEKGSPKRLPDPVAKLKMGPVWLRSQIEQVRDGVSIEEIRTFSLALVGTAEAAEDILDMKRDRIGVWLDKGWMPPPLDRIRAGPLWWRPDVEKLRPERERRRRAG
jgi:hypothetical protein